jgi:hypothetical protein
MCACMQATAVSDTVRLWHLHAYWPADALADCPTSVLNLSFHVYLQTGKPSPVRTGSWTSGHESISWSDFRVGCVEHPGLYPVGRLTIQKYLVLYDV